MSSPPSNVHTHDSWHERIVEFEERLQGRFSWSPGDGIAGAWLYSPAGDQIGAVLLEHAAGIVAALNTPEGRVAWARVTIQ